MIDSVATTPSCSDGNRIQPNFSAAYTYLRDARIKLVMTKLREADILLYDIHGIIASYCLPTKIDFARGCPIDSLFNRFIFWALPYQTPVNTLKDPETSAFQWVHLDSYDTPEIFIKPNSPNIMSCSDNNLIADLRKYYNELFMKCACHFAESLDDIPWFFDLDDETCSKFNITWYFTHTREVVRAYVLTLGDPRDPQKTD